jgi:hypothetical protein
MSIFSGAALEPKAGNTLFSPLIGKKFPVSASFTGRKSYGDMFAYDCHLTEEGLLYRERGNRRVSASQRTCRAAPQRPSRIQVAAEPAIF